MFGAGTACVVCPIDKMQYLDEVYNIKPHNVLFLFCKVYEIPTMTSGCKVAKRAFTELTDIQV